MPEITRTIGLSLGADICWPICFEELIRLLDVRIPYKDDRLRFQVERIPIEPFALQQANHYDLVIDRLTHWYHIRREWIKKSILLNGLYVYNNPWSVQSNEKHTTYCAMIRLRLPIPETWLIPPKAYEPSELLRPTLERYARFFDLGEVGRKIGYPVFIKPYAGRAGIGVSKADNEAELWRAYEESGTLLMNVQAGVLPYEDFVRCIGLGPQTRCVRYDPRAPLHDRYLLDTDFLSEQDRSVLEDTTLTINAFFGWDFNSCEALRKDGSWYPIDFANPCPDNQVTSVHLHFPWLIKANVRWSVFCAATKRRMRQNLDWQPFFQIADQDMSYRERLSAYARLAHERFETDSFQEFCHKHLGHLDEVAHEFFSSTLVRDAVRQEVAALFPPHEVEEFAEIFWSRIQRWCNTEGALT
jgi:hypothetical protein